MSGKESLRNWLLIVAVLVVTSLVAAAWPLVTGSFTGTAVSIDTSTPPITINLPVAIANTQTLNLNAFTAVAILAALVIGGVAIVGAILGGINLLLSRQVTAVQESEEFQAHQSALEQRANEQTKQAREGREAAPMPSHNMPRWSVVSTSLIILMFVTFIGMILGNALLPADGTFNIAGAQVNQRTAVVGGLVILTLLILVWRIQPQQLENIEAADNKPISWGTLWDVIWITLFAAIVIGGGIGFILYLNAPG